MSFEARYQGRCGSCPNSIQLGDQVTYDCDDELVHEDCLRAWRDPRHQIACPTCWLIHPGECDRD